MVFLNVCFYLLASFALLDYLGKLFYERLSEWQEARQLVGGHPEMRGCLLYTSPSPRDGLLSRMPSSA